jgi:hypothetical protein
MTLPEVLKFLGQHVLLYHKTSGDNQTFREEQNLMNVEVYSMTIEEEGEIEGFPFYDT